MYNPQLSRREFLKGTGRGTGALAAADLYSKVAATAGGFGGLVGILGTPSAANSHEIHGLQELREYAKRLYNEVEEYNAVAQREYGKKVQEEIEKHRRKKDVKVLRFDSPPHREPDIFDDYIDGRRVKVKVSQSYTLTKPSLYNLDVDIFDPSNRRAGMSYDNRFDNNDNEKLRDSGVKGNLLGLDDVIYIKKGDSKNWESARWFSDGGYYLLHWRTPEKGENCKSPSYQFPTICFNGKAEYDSPDRGLSDKPILTDYYKATTTHAELQKRHKEEIRISNDKYQRLLRVIINRLVKEGKLKISSPKTIKR